MTHPLTTLNRVPADVIKNFVDDLLPDLEPHGIRVLENRNGLVMLPAQDTAQGATFHLGEVLVSEARVRVGSSEGYSATLGRDLEQALAVALLDAAQREQVLLERIRGSTRVGAVSSAKGECIWDFIVLKATFRVRSCRLHRVPSLPT